MNELMVTRDGRFYGVTIRGILESGSGHPIFVSFRAVDAAWFSPHDPVADDAGWVRDLDSGTVEGELKLGFVDPLAHERAVAQLLAWQDNPPQRLTGVASLEGQYVGLIDVDTRAGVGIRMSAQQQDTP